MSFIGKNIRKIRAVKKLSQADFASLFNLARPSVGAYEEGRAEPKIDTVIAMAQHFGISIDLLLTKEITINELYHFDRYAPGIHQGKGDQEKSQEIVKRARKPDGMAFVSSDKMYEYIASRDTKDFIAGLSTIELPQEKNRVNRAFEIKSNEMHYLQSGIKSGDIINAVLTGKEPGNLSIGGIYFVIAADGYFVRRLRERNKVLVFVADHPDFPEIRIGMEEIDELWEVKGVYSENLEKSTTVESKIHDLEKMVSELLKRVEKLEG